MRSFKGALVVRLLDLVSAYFDNVVIDLPRIWFPWTETILTGSDKVFIVADMTVPSIRHANMLVHAMNDRVGKQANHRVIVNRMDYRKNKSGLTASDVEDALGEYFSGGIPNNYALVSDAVDRGVTLSEIKPNNDVTEALSKLIIDPDIEAIENNQKNSGLFGFGKSLFGRKAG